jgi:hypothetical protein
MTAALETVVPTQIRTSGGSRDTEVKELAVRAAIFPSVSAAVTAVTPLGKCAQTSRNAVAAAAARARSPSDEFILTGTYYREPVGFVNPLIDLARWPETVG